MFRLADIAEEWERIKGDVASLCEGHDESPEDVYKACVEERASLVIFDDGTFIVARLDTLKYSGRLILWVWLAKAASFGAIEKYSKELDNLARSLGAEAIRMGSSRKGWRRVPGWQELQTVYERRLP